MVLLFYMTPSISITKPSHNRSYDHIVLKTQIPRTILFKVHQIESDPDIIQSMGKGSKYLKYLEQKEKKYWFTRR